MGVTTMTSWYSNWSRHYEGLLLNTIIVCQLRPAVSFSTLCTLFEGRFGRQEPPATTRSNLKTIIQRVDEPLPEFAERTLRMAADGYSGMGGEWIQVDAFLMGCTDKRSARSALDRDPKTVDEAVSLMRRFSWS